MAGQVDAGTSENQEARHKREGQKTPAPAERGELSASVVATHLASIFKTKRAPSIPASGPGSFAAAVTAARKGALGHMRTSSDSVLRKQPMLPTTGAFVSVFRTQRVQLYVRKYGTSSPANRSCCALTDRREIARVLLVNTTRMMTALMRTARSGSITATSFPTRLKMTPAAASTAAAYCTHSFPPTRPRCSGPKIARPNFPPVPVADGGVKLVERPARTEN